MPRPASRRLGAWLLAIGAWLGIAGCIYETLQALGLTKGW